MKKIICVFFLTVYIQASHAQAAKDSLPAAATLEQCIQYALVHQPAVAQAQLDEQITKYQIRSRLADGYPQIGANYSLQHTFQRQTSYFNGVAVPVVLRITLPGS